MNQVKEAPLYSVTAGSSGVTGKVICPHCDEFHNHSLGESLHGDPVSLIGLRAAHCGTGEEPYYNSVYLITDPDNLLGD